MYAVAIVRYRKPLEIMEQVLADHRAYLKGLQEQGLILVSGPVEPRIGGVVLLKVPDQDYLKVLDGIRDNDPYVKGGIAQYEILPWNPVMGVENLAKL